MPIDRQDAFAELRARALGLDADAPGVLRLLERAAAAPRAVLRELRQAPAGPGAPIPGEDGPPAS